MRKQIFPFIALSVLALQSCKKDPDNTPPPGNEPPRLQYYAKKMEWNNGVVADITYNTDSTIKSIAYSGLGSSNQLNYTWTGKQLTSISLAASLYKNTFSYSQGLQTGMVNEYKDLTSPAGYKYEYNYAAGGRLSEFKYSTVNEAGANLITTTVYAYKSNGDLESATVTQKVNNLQIKYVIDGWSAEFELHPWLFIDATLTEYHHIYNYPILSSMNKLPVKVTQTIIQAGVPDRVEKITEATYTITNKRLDKITNVLSYPGHPELNQTQWTQFKY